MGKKARHVRYLIQPSSSVEFTIQDVSGETHKLEVVDLSLRGLSFKVAKGSAADHSLQLNQILPAAKLTWDESELSLGRLVIKNKKDVDGHYRVGVLVIDSQIPVEGKIARHLQVDFEGPSAELDLEYGSKEISLGDFLNGNWDDLDVFAKAERYARFQQSLERTDRWGYWIPRQPSMGARIKLKQKRSDGRNDFLLMGSNDYLGLASHPEVLEIAKKTLDDYGFGSTGSAVTVGHTEEHVRLQETLCRILKTESAILFNSGYAAGVGSISSLVGPNDLVVADILSHACLYDGMNLATGAKRYFQHNHMKHLRKILDRNRSAHAGCLIVAEGVFSMDGDSAPLKEIYTMAREYNCRVMIDEAHSFGVLGETGRGLVEEAGLLGRFDLTMGTFSKICGGIGGFAAGKKEVIDWLNVSARSGFFSVSIPPSTAAAMNKALEIFERQPNLITKLRENINHFTSCLRQIGCHVDPSHRSTIVPVIIGDEAKLGRMYEYIYNKGVYTIPVIFPAVSKNNCRFRFTVTANHSISDLDYVVNVLKMAADQFGIDLSATTRKAEVPGQSVA